MNRSRHVFVLAFMHLFPPPYFNEPITEERAAWKEVLEIYLEVIEERTGIRPKVLMPEDSAGLQKVWNGAQIKYDRLYDRMLLQDNSGSFCKGKKCSKMPPLAYNGYRLI